MKNDNLTATLSGRQGFIAVILTPPLLIRIP